MEQKLTEIFSNTLNTAAASVEDTIAPKSIHSNKLNFKNRYAQTPVTIAVTKTPNVASIAPSLTTMRNDYEDFKVAAEFIAELIQKLDAYKIPPKTILNINVPGLEKDDIAGIAVTELGGKMFTNAYEKRVDPRGKVYYWMAGELVNESDEAKTTDIAAIRNNMISITPVTYDMTRMNIMNDLQAQLCKDDFCEWFNE